MEPRIQIIESECTLTTKVLDINGSKCLSFLYLEIALYKYYSASARDSSYFRCWNGKKNSKVCSASCSIKDGMVTLKKEHQCSGNFPFILNHLLGWQKTKGKVAIAVWNSVTEELKSGKTPQEAVRTNLFNF
jgi:hypothetical protein